MKRIRALGLLAMLLSGPVLAGAPTRAGIQDAPPPAYPEEARKAGQEGITRLRLTVTAEGLPEDISIHQSSGYPALDEAALAAVKEWRFQPARDESGRPVAKTVIAPVKFSLQGTAPYTLDKTCQFVLDQVAQLRAAAPDTKLADMEILKPAGGLAVAYYLSAMPAKEFLAFNKNISAFHEAVLADCSAMPNDAYLKVVMRRLKNGTDSAQP